ncbi:ABC transporter substrate-binding protein [Martelella alba]|nr:sugar ABC transporter substrate-binding protein [Martelella alba]
MGMMLTLIYATTISRAQAEPVPLKMWTFLPITGNDPRTVALKQVVEGFNQSQTQYRVSVESISYSRIDSNVIQATAAGEGPDILNVYSDQLAMHVAAKTIIPLDHYIAKLSPAERDGFVMPLKLFSYGGHIMAVPWETRVWLLWYRKDLLQQAGLMPPATLPEMAEDARKLANGQVMGFAMGASSGQLGAGVSEMFTPLIWGAGGEVIDSQGKAIFNSPAGVRVLKFLDQMIKDNAMRSSVVTMTADDLLSSVQAGKTAMTINGSYRVSSARAAAAAGDRLATAPIPGWEKDKPTPARIAGQTLTIGANSKHKDGAWAFIQYYTNNTSQLAFARAGVLPSRSIIYQDTFFSQDPVGREMKGWADYAHAYGRIANLPADYGKLTQLLATAFQQVFLQNADPKQALDRAAAAYNAQHKR